MGIYLPQQIKDQFKEECVKILESGNLAEGEIRKSIESKFTSQNTSALLLNSCGSGIFSALTYFKTLGKDTAIIQSNTFYGVQTIAKLAGYKIIICPSNDDFVMNAHALLGIINNKCTFNSVVIYSHIGGSIAPVFGNIIKICEDNEIPLIEDAAHSFGIPEETYNVEADCRVYSFYATKTASAGEGGLMLIKNKNMYNWIYDFIMYDRLKMKINIGLNLRVSEIQALLIKLVIDNMSLITNNRRKTLLRYKDICNHNLINTLDCDWDHHNAYKFIITDKLVIDNIPKHLTSGTVFNYGLGEFEPIPHICLNTNYGISESLIDETETFLKGIVNV